MTSDPLTSVTTRATPQTRRAEPHQSPNNAGGYGFKVDDDVLIHRWLTIGTTGGTYYVDEKNLTLAAADVVLRAARERPAWLVAQVIDISTAGRAPKQNPTILALAAAAGLGDDEGRAMALRALPKVCRTGSHLLMFVRYAEQFRGWGRGLRRAVSGWFTDRDPNLLAYQMVKYRQRDGWSQRDVLRLAHPASDDPAMQALLRWVARGDVGDATPALVHGYLAAQAATTTQGWVDVLTEHRLPWEALPDAALTDRAVWAHMIGGADYGGRTGLPTTALMRQLPRLTWLGVLDDTALRARVVNQLTDAEQLRRARVHPFAVLLAARTYSMGHSARGSSTWTPHRQIIDALDAGFYAAYGAVEPTGKRTLLALDVSGSMGCPAGGSPISCREASAALALVTMATDQDVDVVGFTAANARRGRWGLPDAALTALPISPRQRLDDAIRAVSNLPFGGTDCALPANWARSTARDYDTIAIFTDSETWAGQAGHPHQALERYRQQVGHPVRQAVVGMTATDISIADPRDPHSLDIAGLDAAVPTLLADFSRGAV